MRKECVFSYFLLSESGTNYLCSRALAGIINRFSSQYPGVSIADFGAESFILLKSGNDMYNRAMTEFIRIARESDL